MKAIILTQEQCPNCDTLKMFLYATTKGAYDHSIEWVKKEDQPDRYKELVKRSETSSTPTVLFMENDDIIDAVKGFTPAAVKNLFEKYL